MRLYHLAGQRVVVENLELAEDSTSRRRGLIGHTPLAQRHGLLIRPCRWVHTFGMSFPIDVVYLDREWRVVALTENLVPNRIGPPVLQAQCVVEMAAGAVGQAGLAVGDQLEVRP
jgi:uncharacterized membrane protein (UPF0127 family)